MWFGKCHVDLHGGLKIIKGKNCILMQLTGSPLGNVTALERLRNNRKGIENIWTFY